MKTRVISAIIMLIIFIPLLFIGGEAFSLGVYLVSLLGLNEFLKIKNDRKYIPSFIKFISYILLTLLILTNTNVKEITFSIDYRILAGLFISYLIPIISKMSRLCFEPDAKINLIKHLLLYNYTI